jgi:hypothetical protein
MLPGFVAAQTASGDNQTPSPSVPSGQVPAPTVSFSDAPRSTEDIINLAVGVNQGQVCGTVWSAHKTNLPVMGSNGPSGETVLSEGFQGEIGTTVANFSSTLEINLGDTNSPPGAPNLNLPSMFIDTAYGSIPISFCDASSFNVQVGNVTYINGLPTVTNTITFNDIALPTYGQGSSSVTFVISQNVIANWTNMIIGIGVYADLSNMKLYLPNGTEIPQGTDFSFNLMYSIDMNTPNLSGNSGPIDYPPSDVTPTSVFFAINGTAGTQLSIGNMNLGDTYTEIQGATQLAGKTPTIYFQQSSAPTWAVNCFQSFSNLTYGVTTAVQSDPTITVQHNAVSAGGVSIGNLTPYIAIVAVVASVTVVFVVISVKRKKTIKILAS